MSKKDVKATKGMSRRALLKGAGALAGAAAGAGAITGFPAVWAAEEKVLRYLGTAVNQSDDITKKVKADTGITIQNIVATTDDVTKRVVTQPNSFDILDTEYFSLKKLVPSGNILAMDAKKIKEFDNITPVFTKGELPNGKKIGDQGTAPKKVMFVEGEHSTKFSKTPTEWVTLIPTVYNADTLGIRPDLIKRPINSWAELLNPEFKGKAAILNIPSIGIMDAAMVVEATGKYKYPDKGNMTKAEIDMTMKVLTEAKKAGQFRAFWKDFNESVNLMASGETVIQSMWSPAVTAVRTKGIPCMFQPLKEGYRSWASGFCMSKGVTPQAGGMGLRVRQLVPVRMGGRLSQPPGLLFRGSLHRQGQYGALRVGLLDGRQACGKGHPGARRLAAREGRRDARRRLLRRPHGHRRLLERGDGRKRLHGPQMERVHRGLSAGPVALRFSPHAGRRARPPSAVLAAAPEDLLVANFASRITATSISTPAMNRAAHVSSQVIGSIASACPAGFRRRRSRWCSSLFFVCRSSSSSSSASGTTTITRCCRASPPAAIPRASRAA